MFWYHPSSGCSSTGVVPGGVCLGQRDCTDQLLNWKQTFIFNHNQNTHHVSLPGGLIRGNVSDWKSCFTGHSENVLLQANESVSLEVQWIPFKEDTYKGINSHQFPDDYNTFVQEFEFKNMKYTFVKDIRRGLIREWQCPTEIKPKMFSWTEAAAYCRRKHQNLPILLSRQDQEDLLQSLHFYDYYSVYGKIGKVQFWVPWQRFYQHWSHTTHYLDVTSMFPLEALYIGARLQGKAGIFFKKCSFLCSEQYLCCNLYWTILHCQKLAEWVWSTLHVLWARFSV